MHPLTLAIRHRKKGNLPWRSRTTDLKISAPSTVSRSKPTELRGVRIAEKINFLSMRGPPPSWNFEISSTEGFSPDPIENRRASSNSFSFSQKMVGTSPKKNRNLTDTTPLIWFGFRWEHHQSITSLVFGFSESVSPPQKIIKIKTNSSPLKFFLFYKK